MVECGCAAVQVCMQAAKPAVCSEYVERQFGDACTCCSQRNTESAASRLALYMIKCSIQVSTLCT